MQFKEMFLQNVTLASSFNNTISKSTMSTNPLLFLANLYPILHNQYIKSHNSIIQTNTSLLSYISHCIKIEKSILCSILIHPPKIVLQDDFLKLQIELLCINEQHECRKLITNDVRSSSSSLSFKITQSQWIQCIRIALDRHRYYLPFGITICHQILSMNNTNNNDDNKLSIIFKSFSSSSYPISMMNDIKCNIREAATMDLLKLLQCLKKLVSCATINLESSTEHQQNVDNATTNIEDLMMKPLKITLKELKKVTFFINESIIELQESMKDESNNKDYLLRLKGDISKKIIQIIGDFRNICIYPGLLLFETNELNGNTYGDSNGNDIDQKILHSFLSNLDYDIINNVNNHSRHTMANSLRRKEHQLKFEYEQQQNKRQKTTKNNYMDNTISYDPRITIYKQMKEDRISTLQSCHELFLADVDGLNENDKQVYSNQFLFSIRELMYCGLLLFDESNVNSKHFLDICCETWSYI